MSDAIAAKNEGGEWENNSENASEEGDVMRGLFVCEDYVEKEWIFKYPNYELRQPLLCSNMSSTDHDLTGQIVWPASILLAWFVAFNRETIFRDSVALEVGAGCGLSGFVAAHYCRHVMLTDGNDVVLRLLESNARHLSASNIKVCKLWWGLQGSITELYPSDDGSLFSTSSQSGGYRVDQLPPPPNVIIGADVILWPNMTFSLLYTLRMLLRRRAQYDAANAPATQTGVRPYQSPRAYISYLERAVSTTSLLFWNAERLGLEVQFVPLESFLPVGHELLVRAQHIDKEESGDAASLDDDAGVRDSRMAVGPGGESNGPVEVEVDMSKYGIKSADKHSTNRYLLSIGLDPGALDDDEAIEREAVAFSRTIENIAAPC